VNMLTIKEANNGKKFLKDDASIAKWGRRSDIRIDRRFKYPAALKAWGENLLSELKDPKFSIEVKAADLSVLPGHEHERRILNSVANVIVGDDTYQVRIIKETIKDLDREHLVDYELGNEIGNIAKTNAEEKKRREAQERYSNGNTNVDSRNFADNCDPTHPAIIRFRIPDDLVNYNKMTLTYETQPFRAYNRAIEGGGAVSTSTEAGGSSQQTSSSGGFTSTSTSSGGGQTQTSTSGGSTTVSSSTVNFNGNTLATGLPVGSITPPYEQHYHLVTLQDNQLQHNHSVSIGSHNHSVTVQPHTHAFEVQAHVHTVNVPAHVHQFELQDHVHGIEFGIYEMEKNATSVTVEVDGNVLPIKSTSGDDIDLIPFLNLNEEGKIRRGEYVEIKITPNTLSRINASVDSRVFISSHIGGVY
jgi:hypothetical protein